MAWQSTRRCGFSQKLIGILNKEEVEYTTFDILGDESVRQSESSRFLSCSPLSLLTPFLSFPSSSRSPPQPLTPPHFNPLRIPSAQSPSRPRAQN